MYTESRFGELSRSLASGFFADKVVMFLARYAATAELRDSDRPIISKAEVFLREALSGLSWLDEPMLTKESVLSADNFDKAALAIPPEIETEAEYVDYLNTLLLYIENIEEGSGEQDEITQLRRFFLEIGKSELMRTEKVFST